MIPIILKKPYILFSFDNESNNYELLNGNQLSFFESETPISNILYTSKTVNGLQLSTFIKNMDQESLQLEDSSAPLYRHTLEIEYLHKKMTISLIAWNFEKIVYAVIIESEDPLIKQ